MNTKNLTCRYPLFVQVFLILLLVNFSQIHLFQQNLHTHPEDLSASETSSQNDTHTGNHHHHHHDDDSSQHDDHQHNYDLHVNWQFVRTQNLNNLHTNDVYLYAPELYEFEQEILSSPLKIDHFIIKDKYFNSSLIVRGPPQLI